MSKVCQKKWSAAIVRSGQGSELTKRLHIILSLLLLLAVLTTIPVLAGFHQGNAVTMGGSPVFSIPCGADGFSPEKRAWLAQDALDNALVLSNNKGPDAVSVSHINGAPVVMLGGYQIITADGASSEMENISAEQLAYKWADSIRQFLSDNQRVTNYLASLTGKYPVEATVAVLERKLYAPAGFTLPVSFITTISSKTAKAGDKVEAKVVRHVPLGHFVVPAESTVIGELIESEPGVLTVAFTTLRTPSGTELPISASVREEYLVASAGPRRVCTLAIPADPTYHCRIPASVGIGTAVQPGEHKLAIVPGAERVIVTGQPASIVFSNVTPIAVVTRDHAM